MTAPLGRRVQRLDVARADAAIYRCPRCAVWRIAPRLARVRHACRLDRQGER